MKAIVCHGYGGPEALRLEEVDRPTPGEGEVLIQVRAASLNAYDRHLLKGRPVFMRLFLGLRRPTAPYLGRDVAGRVESVGPGVTRFEPGDDVFGLCRGSLVEYACSKEVNLAAKPANVSFEEAAAIPLAGLTALQGLRNSGRIESGQRVLVNGASGGVGTFAVQIAKSFGAEVTGVCSTRNLEMVRSIGADHVIDYTREDLTRSGMHYDLVYDLVGNHSFAEYRRVLSAEGRLVPAGLGGADGRHGGRRLVRMMTTALTPRFGKQKIALCMARLSQDDLVTLGGLLASRKVTSVIDSRHRLSEAPEAMRRLAEGHASGKIVVLVDP